MVARAFSAENEQGPRPAVRGREQAGRRRQHRRQRGSRRLDPEEFADFIAKEQARWKEVVQKAHVKIE